MAAKSGGDLRSTSSRSHADEAQLPGSAAGISAGHSLVAIVPVTVCPCEAAGYSHGGLAPFEQTTVEPGGTTIVVLFEGGRGLLLLKLRKPPRASGISMKIRRLTRMGSILNMTTNSRSFGSSRPGSENTQATTALHFKNIRTRCVANRQKSRCAHRRPTTRRP